MFVMLSVRTTSVRERHAKTAKETKVTNIDNTILLNKNSIEKLFTKSLSFEKNINNSNLILAKPNNLKEPPTQQVQCFFIHFSLFSFLFLFILFFFLCRKKDKKDFYELILTGKS